MKNLIISNKFFLLPYVIILILCIPIFILFDKAEIHIAINNIHFPILDIFFKNTTYLGDGYFALIIMILFLFIRYRWSIIILFSSFGSGIIVQLCKKVIFSDASRPLKYLKGEFNLYIVEGVKVYKTHSFPSGHTTIAFCIFLFLALITKNNYLKSVLLFLALMVAYSRMYLSQHFLVDVYVGSILGSTFTLLVFYFVMKWKNKNLEKSLISKLK